MTEAVSDADKGMHMHMPSAQLLECVCGWQSTITVSKSEGEPMMENPELPMLEIPPQKANTP